MKINSFKKENMKLLTKERQESYDNAKICYICKENFENKHLKDKKYFKARYHCHSAAYIIQNIVYLKKFLELFIMI